MIGSFLLKKLDFNQLLPKNTITLNNQFSNKKKKFPKSIKEKKTKNQFSEKNPNLLFGNIKLQKHPNCIHLIYENTLTSNLTIVVIKIIKQFFFFFIIIF
jgi:hypothetical protein